MKNVIVIGIAGGTGSGKSTISRKIIQIPNFKLPNITIDLTDIDL